VRYECARTRLKKVGTHMNNNQPAQGRTDIRIDIWQVAPEAKRALLAVERYVRQSGLEPPLLELVKVRASQINGCAYCVDMHTQDARAHGETEQRLYAIAVWREAPFFTPRERAALAWAEAVTLVSQGHVPDKVFRTAREQFTEKELVDLTMALAAINSWNRLMVSFRMPAGSYQPAQAAGAEPQST
jgi:AhpD family alkylhydroperoxidase